MSCSFSQSLMSLYQSLCLTEAMPEFINYTSEVTPTLNDASDAHIFIGDNINHLYQLALTSPHSVNVCYIDPPYNTGSDFLYPDSIKSKQHPIYGSHAAWMSFMLPRLYLTRTILKSNGVIAISIDDHEYAYLKLIMDRIFGEANFICNVVVCRTKNGVHCNRNVSTNHEYLLIYGASPDVALKGEKSAKHYPKTDDFGSFNLLGMLRKKGDASLRTDRPNLYFPLYYDKVSGKVSVDPVPGWDIAYPIDSQGVERRWIWSKETAKSREHRLFASKNGVIYIKNYEPTNEASPRQNIKTLWNDPAFFTSNATNEIKSIFGIKVFDTPKPISFVKKIISTCADNDAIILDYFTGSATTAHAAHELNQQDGGSRKVILMESNQPIPSQHIAKKMGFEAIGDIAIERLKIIKQRDPNYTFTQYTPQSGS